VWSYLGGDFRRAVTEILPPHFGCTMRAQPSPPIVAARLRQEWLSENDRFGHSPRLARSGFEGRAGHNMESV
jgi:hypothetical protein